MEFVSKHVEMSENGDSGSIKEQATMDQGTSRSKIFAYSTFDEKYKNLIEEGLADHYLEVFSNNTKVRTLKMESCVMQVICTRAHVSDHQVGI